MSVAGDSGSPDSVAGDPHDEEHGAVAVRQRVMPNAVGPLRIVFIVARTEVRGRVGWGRVG